MARKEHDFLAPGQNSNMRFTRVYYCILAQLHLNKPKAVYGDNGDSFSTLYDIHYST